MIFTTIKIENVNFTRSILYFVGVVSLILNILSKTLLIKLGLDTIFYKYQSYISLIMICIIVITFFDLTIFSIKVMQHYFKRKKDEFEKETKKQLAINYLYTLNIVKKGILREFIMLNQNNIVLPNNESNVEELLQK